MEPLTTVVPLGTNFTMRVAKRHAHWYAVEGYEPLSTSLFRHAAQGSDVVLDIGAHVGWYSVTAALASENARVIAVEANPQVAEVCQENCGAIVPGQVEVRSAAFAAQAGEVAFHLTEASDNGSLSGHPDSPTVEVVSRPAITGQELNIAPGGHLLVKVDVEGHELSALAGLEPQIDSAHSVRLLIEFNPLCLTRAGSSSEALLTWLRGHGFAVFLVDDRDQRWSVVRPDQPARELDERVGLYANLYCVRGTETLGVAFVLHSSDLGGAERSTLSSVANLTAAGNLVHCYLPEEGGGALVRMLADAGATVGYHQGRWWVGDEAVDPRLGGPSAHRLAADLVLWPPHVVVSVTAAIPTGCVAAHMVSLPHVWSLHEFLDRDHGLQSSVPLQDLGAFVAKYSEAIVVNSAPVGRHLLPEGTAFTVVPPVSLATLATIDQSAASQAPVRVLGVFSGFQPSKGHAELFAAVAQLRAEGRDLQLRVFGAGWAADVRRLERLAEELGLGAAVVFEGRVRDPLAKMAEVDVVVMPSHAEAFGRVPIEAIFVGRPVVYCRGSGMDDYMVDGVIGVACEPADSVDLARALRDVMDDQALRDRLAQQARPAIEEWIARCSPEGTLLGVLRSAAHPSDLPASWADHAMGDLVGAALAGAVSTQGQLEQCREQLLQRDERLHRLVLAADEERAMSEAQADALRGESRAIQEGLDALQEGLDSLTSTVRFRVAFGWRPRLAKIRSATRQVRRKGAD